MKEQKPIETWFQGKEQNENHACSKLYSNKTKETQLLHMDKEV